jgi:dTMP kinase
MVALSERKGRGLKGCLITFEGTEGSGKTVTSRHLQKKLESEGYNVLWTREPTESRIGSLIEDILERKTRVSEEALPLLFAADRADHTQRILIPAIKKGSIVLCDRYVHSSLAYQRSGMSKPFQKYWLEEINRYSVKPDLVLFLDISPEEGLRRIERGQRIHDDKFFENLETQKAIRDAYYDVLNLNKPLVSFFKRDIFPTSFMSKLRALSTVDHLRVVSVDASLSQEAVQDIVCEVVRRFLRFKEIHKRGRLQPKEFLSLFSNSDSLPSNQSSQTISYSPSWSEANERVID